MKKSLDYDAPCPVQKQSQDALEGRMSKIARQTEAGEAALAV